MKLKISEFYKTNFFYIYTQRLVVLNLLGFFCLSDSISFNQGFVSIQSIFYSLNYWISIFFVFIETLFVFLDEYSLNIEFLYVIFSNIFNLNYSYNFYILFEQKDIISFLIFSLIYLIVIEKKINSIDVLKKKVLTLRFFLIFSLIITLILIILIINNKLNYHLNKFKNYDKSLISYGLFRNDNWYINNKSYFVNSKESKVKIEKSKHFNEIINENYENIYVIINESYPNFKDKKIKQKLFNKLITKNTNYEIYQKSWNKKYSTLGAEIEFFCNNDDNFENFMEEDLDFFVKKNNCWITKFKDKNKTFIHSYKESFFNRYRYNTFFQETYFQKDLEKLNFPICDGTYNGICDYSIIDNLEKLLPSSKNNFVIFLTLNGHIPSKLIDIKKKSECRNIYPLYVYEEFCVAYLNQALFNERLSKFIDRTLKPNDILILFSDTPPAFPKKRKEFFEDYVEIFTFKKKNY